jgi:hypothetical protein
MASVNVVGDIANPYRMSFRVASANFVDPPRYDRKGRFQGPNRDMNRLNQALRDLLGNSIVVEYGNDPANSGMAYVAVTLSSSNWDNKQIADAGALIAQAAGV